MKNYKLLIFDLDGTLINSQEGIAQAVIATLQHFSLPLKSPDEIVSYVGTGVEDLIRKSTNLDSGGLFTQTMEFFKQNFSAIADIHSQLYPHVCDILNYFNQKEKIIITNRKRAIALRSLSYFKIDHYFSAIIGGDDLTCMKPSGCPLEKCMAQLNVEKQYTIIIGDMAIDINAGKNAGIDTCALTSGIGKKEAILHAQPDYVISDIIQLKTIITA